MPTMRRWAFDILAGLALAVIAVGCQTGGNDRPPLPPIQIVSLETGSLPANMPLTVGTYNVHWLDDRNGVRTILYRLQHVNVWCLQEVRTREGDEAGLVATMSEILPPGAWHIAIARTNRLRERRSTDWEAQVIASRIPISEARVWELDSSGDKCRVGLVVQISVQGEPLLVVNTDHEPSFLPLTDRNGRQLAVLATRLTQVAEQHVIVAGDFHCAGNLWRGYGNSSHVRRIDSAFTSVGFLPVGVDQPTFMAGPLSLLLDRIYTANLRVIRHDVERETKASDHLPVWCSVELVHQ